MCRTWKHKCYPSAQRLTQEDNKELKASLGYRVRLSKNSSKYREREQSASSKEGERVPDKVMSGILAS